MGKITDEEEIAEPSLIEAIHDTQPMISDPTFKSTIIDTVYDPVASLLQYIEGSPVVVDYWGQVKGADQVPDSLDVHKHPIYSQYINIREMEIRLQGDVAYTQTDQTNESQLQGTAVLYPGIIPNKGDVFIMDIGDGRAGVFHVVEVERKTIRRDTCFEITFHWKGYPDDHRNLYAELKKRAVRVVNFKKEFLNHGKNHLLTNEDVGVLEVMDRRVSELTSIYFAQFYDNETRTFLMPNDATLGRFYDHYVVKTFISTTDTETHPLITNLKLYNVDGAENMNDLNFWSLLTKMDFSLLPVLTKKMWMAYSKAFPRWPVYGGVYHSKIDSVVYPLNRTPGCYNEVSSGGFPMYELLPPSILDVFRRTVLTGFDQPIPDEDGLPEDPALIKPPLIHPVNKDNFYVLSQAFYEKAATGQSVLELITSNVLSRKVYDYKYLIEVCDDIHNWTPLDRFYYIPLLLILLKIGRRNF
jgi:hypothetical protein